MNFPNYFYYSRSQRQKQRKRIGKYFRELEKNESLPYISDDIFKGLCEIFESHQQDDLYLATTIIKQFRLNETQYNHIRQKYFNKIML